MQEHCTERPLTGVMWPWFGPWNSGTWFSSWKFCPDLNLSQLYLLMFEISGLVPVFHQISSLDSHYLVLLGVLEPIQMKGLNWSDSLVTTPSFPPQWMGPSTVGQGLYWRRNAPLWAGVKRDRPRCLEHMVYLPSVSFQHFFFSFVF